MINFNHPDLQNHTTLNKTFSDVKLHPLLVEALKSIGYEKPTLVQFHSMPLAVDRRNIVVQSKSGTGKTLAFVGVVMQRLIEEGIRGMREEVEERKGGVAKVRVLVLEPTRELAVQVYQFIRKVMAAFKNIKPVDDLHKQIKSIINSLTAGLNIGGLPIDDDKKNYHQCGFDITVGTIGRIFQLTQKHILDLSSCLLTILDQGDKLFQQADSTKRTKSILGHTANSQLLVYSATYTERSFGELSKLKLEWMLVKTVAVGMQEMQVRVATELKGEELRGESMELGNIRKMKCRFSSEERSVFGQKLAKAKQLLTTLPYQKCLLFVQKKAQMPQVSDYLKPLNPLTIHGSLSQSSRIKLLNQLNSSKLIITSDLLARGIDLMVDFILLFNAAQGENFWHRIGRTGRIGRKGVVVSLDEVEGWEEFTLERAVEGLREARFQPRREVFGEYMTEMGRWHEVDDEKETENVNGYRYFDEQQFEKEIKHEIQVEEQLAVVHQEFIPPSAQSLTNHTHPPITLPTLHSQSHLRQYIRTLLSCHTCLQHLQHTQHLTGYHFKLLQYF